MDWGTGLGKIKIQERERMNIEIQQSIGPKFEKFGHVAGYSEKTKRPP